MHVQPHSGSFQGAHGGLVAVFQRGTVLRHGCCGHGGGPESHADAVRVDDAHHVVVKHRRRGHRVGPGGGEFLGQVQRQHPLVAAAFQLAGVAGDQFQGGQTGGGAVVSAVHHVQINDSDVQVLDDAVRQARRRVSDNPNRHVRSTPSTVATSPLPGQGQHSCSNRQGTTGHHPRCPV